MGISSGDTKWGQRWVYHAEAAQNRNPNPDTYSGSYEGKTHHHLEFFAEMLGLLPLDRNESIMSVVLLEHVAPSFPTHDRPCETQEG